MNQISPEAKITIIVEGLGDDITKLVVPLASKVEYGVSNTYDLETGYTADEMHFSFGCYALYDIDRNLVVEDHRGLTRAQYEDQIIAQARNILRERWMDKETKSVDTTSIIIVKGEN